MTLTEKAAYIKGMMEGMNFDATTNEGKLLAKIVELLDEMALTVEDLESQVDAIDDFTDELAEYAEEIDDDLTDLEDLVLDEDDDDWDDEDEEEYEDEDEDEDEDFWADEDEDEDYDGYETECPICGATVFFTDEDDPEDVVCPACGEHFSCLCDGNCDDCGDPCPARDEKPEKE